MDPEHIGWADVVAPIFAFLAVIVAPTCIAIWVIVRTLGERTPEPAPTGDTLQGE